MEQIKRKSFFKVLHFSAFVLAAAFIMGLLIGCHVRYKSYPYTVEHWQEDIHGSYTHALYTKVEKDTEVKMGTTAEYTQAQAKTYEGFTAKPIRQKRISSLGDTIVRVYYDRNISTITLDLGGGSVSVDSYKSVLEEDGGKTLLKGKYGHPLCIYSVEKENNIFLGWSRELPKTFPLVSPTETYRAIWKDGYIVTIKGDDRTEIPDNTFIKSRISESWSNIIPDAEQKVVLKPEWQTGDYGIYEWRYDDENGEKIDMRWLSQGCVMVNDITLYAVINYNKFKFGSEYNSGIIGYTGEKPRGKIIIPEECYGISNTSSTMGLPIGAFQDCKEITSVIFPEHCYSIGQNAFLGCTGLKELKLPTGLTKIESNAFKDCKGLTKLDLSGCTKLTKIESDAFKDCKGLTELDLSGCTKLTKIKSDAFKDCTSLKELKLPQTLTVLSGFSHCTSLTNIDISRCTKLTEINYHAFTSCLSLTSIDLSDCISVQEISGYAFGNCSELKDLKLPISLTKIGEGAFCGCNNLTEVDLSYCKNLTQISESAFKGCIGLTSIELPKSITSLGGFAGCTGLTSMDLSDCTSLTKIDDWAFFRCINAEIKLPETIIKIGKDAFGDDENSWCKKVLIKFDTNFNRIKQLVIDSGYPEERIRSYW